MGSQGLTYLIMRFLLLAAVAVCGVRAQDTYHCPDGWLLEEDRSGCRCFYFSEGEAVTRDNADILCSFHDAWVAELDHPGINYWLKAELLKITEVGEREQFWLGAKTGAVMTLTTTKVNGPGSIRTRPLNGLIGLMVNPTTGTTRTAWCWPNSTDHYSPLPGITTGTTGFVREQVLTIFVRKNANKLMQK